MENTLEKLKVVHSSSLIIILFDNNLRVYDDDAKIVEFISNFTSDCNVIVFKLKYLQKTIEILKSKSINYVILDKENNYKVYDYYYTFKNNYNKYLILSRKFNKIRRFFVRLYNFIFDISFNRYK